MFVPRRQRQISLQKPSSKLMTITSHDAVKKGPENKINGTSLQANMASLKRSLTLINTIQHNQQIPG